MKLTQDHVQSLFMHRGFMVLGVYKNSHTPLDVLCPQGHRSSVCVANFKSGHGCNECSGRKKITQEDAEKKFAEYGYTLLSKYERNSAKCSVRCDADHEIKITLNNFQNGHRCAICSQRNKYTQEEVELILSADGYKLLDRYKNNHSQMMVECPKGHKRKIRFSDFNCNGYRCKTCATKRGPEHPNWNPLRNREKHRGEQHAQWRISVFRRDKFTCVSCRVHSGLLNAHHVENWSSNPDKRFDIENGITFCQSCHRRFHKIYGSRSNTRLQLNEFLQVGLYVAQ